MRYQCWTILSSIPLWSSSHNPLKHSEDYQSQIQCAAVVESSLLALGQHHSLHTSAQLMSNCLSIEDSIQSGMETSNTRWAHIVADKRPVTYMRSEDEGFSQKNMPSSMRGRDRNSLTIPAPFYFRESLWPPPAINQACTEGLVVSSRGHTVATETAFESSHINDIGEREGQRETDGLSMLVVSSLDGIGVQLERDNTELSQPLQKEFSQCTTARSTPRQYIRSKYLEWIPSPSAQIRSKYLEWIPPPSAQIRSKYLEWIPLPSTTKN
ncbi:hypothetical protein NQZ68_008624 [Dissostichus eleginoides]|nr:hypothetical protein NQZ68_008624 [Dissostichus eleginoides]